MIIMLRYRAGGTGVKKSSAEKLLLTVLQWRRIIWLGGWRRRRRRCCGCIVTVAVNVVVAVVVFHFVKALLVINLPQPLYFPLQCFLMCIFENLVLGQSCDSLLESTVIHVQQQALMVQKGNPRRQHRNLGLQRVDATFEF